MSTEVLEPISEPTLPELTIDEPKHPPYEQKQLVSSKTLVEAHFERAQTGDLKGVPCYEDVADAMLIEFQNPRYFDAVIAGKETQYPPGDIELARAIHREAQAAWAAEKEQNHHPYTTIPEHMHTILRRYEYLLPHRPLPKPKLKKLD